MADKIYYGSSPILDSDESTIRAEIEARFQGGISKTGSAIGMQFSPSDIHAAIDEVSRLNPYHPVREYLDSLEWDGVERIAYVPDEILGVERTKINQAIVRRWFVSAVKRVIEPGCKADTVLVLVGAQGVGKSTFFNILGGEFYIECGTSLDHKDIYLTIRNGWIVELSELSSMRSARDIESVKRFLSTQVDSYRPPYGRNEISVPRTSVFGASTNTDDFLADPTGARRFLPVAVGDIANDLLREQRDQLWAEAVVLHMAGEHAWLDKEESALLTERHAEHAQLDVWMESIDKFTSLRTEVTIRDVLVSCLEFMERDIDRRAEMRVASCLRALRFEKRKSHGIIKWIR
jgi:putative DNA primase/helicase